MIEALIELYPDAESVEHRSDGIYINGQKLEDISEIEAKQAEIDSGAETRLSIERKKRELSQQIVELEQQCMRPLLEIHYLQRQGKDTAQEDAFLNQRYAQILIKRAELQALESNA